MLELLYVLVALVVVVSFMAGAFALGVRRAVWLCLLLLPFQIVLPPEIGRVVGYENLFLVPDVLVPLTFLVWLAKRIAGGGVASLRHVVPGPFLLVLVAFLLSARAGMDVRDYVSEIQKWCVYVLAFVLVSQTIRSPDDLRRAATVLIIGGALATFRDAAAYFGAFTLPAPLGYRPDADPAVTTAFGRDRYAGTGGPVFINTLALFTFVRVVVLGPALSQLKRWALTAFAGVLVVLVALSFYRGDWIALVAAVFAGLAFPAMRSFRFVWTGASVAAVSAVVLGLVLGGQFTNALLGRAATVAAPTSEAHVIMRADAVAEAWQMFLDHPLTGIGAGQYGANFAAYSDAQLFGQAVDPAFFQQANNDYFQYLATTGVVGLFALAVLFSTFLLRGLRLALGPGTDRWTRATVLGCVLGLVNILVDAMSEDPMWIKTHGTLCFVLFGFIWAASAWGDQAPLRAAWHRESVAAT